MELQEFACRTMKEMNEYIKEKDIGRSQIISMCRNNNRIVLLYEVDEKKHKRKEK